MPADVIVAGQPFVLVVEPRAAPAVVVAAGNQGPPGPAGQGLAEISPDQDNQIEERPNGLYVAPHRWALNQW